jgi:hypothetical protein
MGSVNFAAPFQFLRSIGGAATQYPQPYDILGALAQMQPMPPAPPLRGGSELPLGAPKVRWSSRLGSPVISTRSNTTNCNA